MYMYINCVQIGQNQVWNNEILVRCNYWKKKKTQTNTYVVGTMVDYFFSKKELASKGWVYGYLAHSFKKLVLTFDMWFSKIIKLVWPLMKVLMNQKTNSKKLPWTIGFL